MNVHSAGSRTISYLIKVGRGAPHEVGADEGRLAADRHLGVLELVQELATETKQ